MNDARDEGRVVQGSFIATRPRHGGRVASTAQPMLPRRPTPPPPRPDLLPAKMRGAAVQPALGTIDTPEFLPGMRPSRVGERRTAMVGRSPHSVFTTPVSSVLLRAMGPGRPLEPRLCAAMEALFETDLSRVTVHEGPTTRTMGALAVTRGDQIHFEAGTYDPTTPEGIQLLGHELAHVVQQRQGRVENPYRRGIAIVQDPVLEAEADRASRAVAKAIVPSHGARTLPWLARHPSRSPSTSAIQRASGRRSMVDLSDVDIHDIPNFDAMGSESHGGGGTFDYFSATGSMGEWARAGAHGLTNLVTGQGRWATVLGLTHGGKSTGRRAVDVGGGDSRGDNKPSDTTLSARTYARGMNTRYHWLRGQWLDVRYDWTHLFGLGIGGSNDDDNIVAATHWANGEMLAIENWISSNHWRNDLYIWVNATLAWGSAHLAEAIYYYVYNGDQRIYYRSIDARRVVALTKRERSGIADALDRGLRKTL